MTVLLEHRGYEVVTAKSTTEGLKLAGHGGFALIILNSWFEKGDGIELCRQIRSFDTRTPILFFSSAAYKADVLKAIEAGAQDYLIKPRGIEALIETVEGLTHPASRPPSISAEAAIKMKASK